MIAESNSSERCELMKQLLCWLDGKNKISMNLQRTLHNNNFECDTTMNAVGVDKYIIVSPKSGQTIIQNLHPESLSHFWKQREGSVIDVAQKKM